MGVHQGTNEPFGTLADKTLRLKRIAAHRAFDQLPRIGMSRKQSYKWLQAKFALNKEQAHIGKFSSYMCDEVITACTEALQNNRRTA